MRTEASSIDVFSFTQDTAGAESNEEGTVGWVQRTPLSSYVSTCNSILHADLFSTFSAVTPDTSQAPASPLRRKRATSLRDSRDLPGASVTRGREGGQERKGFFRWQTKNVTLYQGMYTAQHVDSYISAHTTSSPSQIARR